jgi:hypothetical protein
VGQPAAANGQAQESLGLFLAENLGDGETLFHAANRGTAEYPTPEPLKVNGIFVSII